MIFEDPTARRWRSFLIAFFTFLLVGGGLAAAFVAALKNLAKLLNLYKKQKLKSKLLNQPMLVLIANFN
jgi:hypothetical protein